MTLLQVMAGADAGEVRLRSTDAQVIAAALAERGIAFDRWPAATAPVDSDAALLADYRDRIDALNADGRYAFIDVARVHDPDPATAAAARAKFLAEHSHAEDEVRFFAAGRACFYLHLGDEVAAVVCEAGDLLSVPAGTRHWFDMGARPGFAAIRFFERADGWVGEFTGDTIAERFPTLDELTGGGR